MLTGDIAVIRADRIGGAHGVIGQLVVLRDLPNQRGSSLPIRQLLAQEGVEDGTGGVQGLQIVLNSQSFDSVPEIKKYIASL